MSLDLSFYKRGELSRHPITVRDIAAIERRAGSTLNLVVGVMFATVIGWILCVILFAL